MTDRVTVKTFAERERNIRATKRSPRKLYSGLCSVAHAYAMKGPKSNQKSPVLSPSARIRNPPSTLMSHNEPPLAWCWSGKMRLKHLSEERKNTSRNLGRLETDQYLLASNDENSRSLGMSSHKIPRQLTSLARIQAPIKRKRAPTYQHMTQTDARLHRINRRFFAIDTFDTGLFA